VSGALILWYVRCLECGHQYTVRTVSDEDPDTMHPPPLCPNCRSDVYDFGSVPA
jgi:NAD-dependent SIR2 family protein deacetylase